MLNVSEILIGGAQALMIPPAEDAAGEYSAGMIGVVAMLCMLAAQEAEGAAAIRYAENRRMRLVFADAVADGSAGPLGDRLAALAAGQDDDLRLSALEQSGDKLRDALISLHVHAEETGARVLDLRIIQLLRHGAQARRLSIPH